MITNFLGKVITEFDDKSANCRYTLYEKKESGDKFYYKSVLLGV